MANLLFLKLFSLAYLLYSANASHNSRNSERGLSFNFSKFQDTRKIDDFQPLETDGIFYLGDAASSGSVVHLTNSSNQKSSGRIVYNETIQLSAIANFSTHFVFSMHSPDNDSHGDGIAFFLSPEGNAYNIPQFTYGGWFGLAGSRLDKLPDLFAVAFDSLQNKVGTFNHNFSRLHYLSYANFSGLNNGTVWEAIVDYNSKISELNVYLSSGSHSLKSPRNLILSHRVNLSEYFSPNVSIGLSSAAVGSNETHNIFSWSFNSSLYSANTSKGLHNGPNGLEMGSNGKGRNQARTSKLTIFVGAGCGIATCIACALLGYFSFQRRKRANAIRGQKLADMDLENFLHHIPRRFSFDDLIAGTKNFREDQKLGQGGFGGVYKCNLAETHEIVAVKRISEGSRQGIKEVISEVSIVSRLRHRNLVQLLGWCHERDELLLVYEYMSNGSLDKHIFTGRRGEEEETQVLQWNMRYKIACKIASALLYLHEGWDECVVHRDVKSSNILLDSNFNTKIGDFGLARMLKHEHLSQTTQAAGTLGYLAPECVATGKTSPESDVYSFGAVALEIACGKRVIDFSMTEFDLRLVAWVWDLYGRGRLLEAADARLNGEFEKEEIERLMVVGLWCSHPHAASRPKMRQVVRLLNFEVAAPVLPPAMPEPSYAHSSFITGLSLSVVSHSHPTTLSPR